MSNEHQHRVKKLTQKIVIFLSIYSSELKSFLALVLCIEIIVWVNVVDKIVERILWTETLHEHKITLPW